MKKNKLLKYNEPIFYFNGDDSSFFNASELSLEGITLSNSNNIPANLPNTLLIKFSIPKSDLIITANVSLVKVKNYFFLQFNSLDNKSKDLISNYFKSSSTRNLSLEY